MRARSAKTVSLYSPTGKPLIHITPERARQLRDGGIVRLTIEGRGANERILAAQYIAAPKVRAPRGTTITVKEMQINASPNWFGGRRRAHTYWNSAEGLVRVESNVVDEVMSKIELYPDIGDTRAPRVGGRRLR